MSDPMELEDVRLETVCNGLLASDFADAMTRCIRSFREEWADPTKAREIKVVVSLKPDDDGNGVRTSYEIDVKLPQEKRAKASHAFRQHNGLVQYKATQQPLFGAVRPGWAAED